MYVNRTAKNNPEKHFFELLQIRIFLTDECNLHSVLPYHQTVKIALGYMLQFSRYWPREITPPPPLPDVPKSPV